MTEAPAAGEEPASSIKEISFHVKSSSESKYTVTVPETMTVLELKEKLSTSEYADVPPERQRLIYSGRVLKDADPLSTYKIKDGNTVHMVKSAASSQRPTSSTQGSSASVPPGAGQPTGVPTNIAAGTGNDFLAGLTGARYAGFAQMPGANTFGPDGGMGPPQSEDEMLRMLENPMFQAQMNEAMNNPQVIQMLRNSPMMRNSPWLRQMIENPEVRRMMMDPNVIRQSMQMSRMMGGMGGMGGTGQPSMPAPGVTDTTPQTEAGTAARDASGADPSQAGATGTTSPPPQQQPQQQQQQNPFMMFGQPGAGQMNPFAALFGGMNPQAGSPSATSPPPNTTASNPTASATPENPANAAQNNTQIPQGSAPPPFNPFGNLFGAPGQTQPQPGQPQQGQNPMASMAQQMMQNPEMMRMAMEMMGGGAGGGGGGNTTGGQGAFNPFGGAFGAPPSSPPPPQDTRPPEEQYAEQLRQLNEMGFYEFERNVRALRMSGGSVQGAVEVLLSGV